MHDADPASPLTYLTPHAFSRHALPMRFFSDNAAPVHPAVMQAMADANHIDTAYDGDQYSARLDAAFSELFGRDAAVLWVATGTSANVRGMASQLNSVLSEIKRIWCLYTLEANTGSITINDKLVQQDTQNDQK
jgi:hypothetical protein